MPEPLTHNSPAKPKELLCVDDDPDTLKLRKLVLEAAGYSVNTADSGESALQVLAEGAHTDLVLLDYLMPGMDGNELALKLHEQYPHLPLIAVSAIGQLPESLLKVVHAHIQKGQGPELLLSTISGILAELHAQDLNKQDLPKGTVLCVDDEELQLKVRRMLFESSGYRVIAAQDASTAIGKFRASPLDAVIMDYSLFGQTGVEIAEQMKRLRPSIPIVILSGSGAAIREENPSVDLWLRKMDLEPEELVKEVARLIEFRKSEPRVANS
jgi:CheY-like chemotaxis protein